MNKRAIDPAYKSALKKLCRNLKKRSNNPSHANDEDKAVDANLKKAGIFSKLVENGIVARQVKEFQQQDPQKLLIEEISKPKLKERLTTKDKRKIAEDPTQRKVENIQALLKFLPGFKKFLKYYNIDDEAVRTAAGFITYKKYPKGTYVFRQNGKSDCFYGIISGKVSIRERKNLHRIDKMIFKKSNSSQPASFFSTGLSILKNKEEAESTEEMEDDKMMLMTGQCFGEWGLIYKQERSSSAFCVEETDLFLLDLNSFELSFSKCMIKSEYDRKIFLVRALPFFKTVDKHKFDIFYKRIVAKFLSKGDRIYLEGTPADSLYVVYQGVCSMQKKITEPKGENRIIKVLFIEYGDIAGMESINYVPNFFKNFVQKMANNLQSENPSKKETKSEIPLYKTSLITEEDNTIVIQIKISSLNDMREGFKNSLLNFKNQKDKILNTLIEHNLAVKHKNKVVYREELIRKGIKGNNEIPKIDEKKYDAQVKDYLKNNKTVITPKNNVRILSSNFEKVNDFKKQKTLFIKSKLAATTAFFRFLPKGILNSSFYKNINYDKKLEEEMTKKMTANNNNNNNNNDDKSNCLLQAIENYSKMANEVKKVTKINAGIGGFGMFFSVAKKSVNQQFQEKEKEKEQNDNTHLESSTIIEKTADNSKNISQMLFKPESAFSKNSQQTDATTTDNMIIVSVLSPNERLPSLASKSEPTKENKGTETSNTNHRNLTIATNSERKSAKSELYLDKQLVCNIKGWHHTLHSKKFDSGLFEIPLISFSIKK